MNIPTTLKPSTPVYVDKPIALLQDGLKSNLTWLDYSFGRSQKLTKRVETRTVSYPGVHFQYEEYLSMFPNDEFGNFCFWDIDDPEELSNYDMNGHNQIVFRASVIFWVNLNNIYSNTSERNTEALKQTVLTALKGIYLTEGRLEPLNIYKRAENIYRGYNINEIDSQYLMQPYYGFRIECNLRTWEGC